MRCLAAAFVDPGTRRRDFVRWVESMAEGALLREVVPDECVWEMERADDGGKKVVVTLHKRRATLAMHHWNCVVKGEPVIDVEKFGPPVVGVNGNDPGAIARMLEDMGGPNDGGR